MNFKKETKSTFLNSKRMVIYGVSIPMNKLLTLALTKLYGIGLFTAKKICAELGLSPRIYVGDLTGNQQYILIRKIKENLRIESSLKDVVKGNIQALIENGSLRGFRHRNRLPVRGQRTHTNARTARRVIFGMALRNRTVQKR